MANRTTYTSSMQHTRVRFKPLVWSCTMRCLTPQSPVTQKRYLDLEVATDRSVTPCCVLPELVVNDPDGVMDVSGGNMLLSATAYDSQYDYVRGHEWYVDGVEISSAWTEGTDYSITYSAGSAYNGMLTIYKNLDAGEVVSLQYRGVFADTRTATNMVVVSDTMELECLEAGDEALGMSIAPSIITWDPLRDGKLLADYLTGLGESASYEDDGRTYTRTATVSILQGTTALSGVPDGYTLGYYLSGTDTEVTEDDDYVESIDGLSITFDMRCVEDTSLEVRLVDDGSGLVIQRCTLDLLFEPTAVKSVRPKSACDMFVSQETYANEAVISTSKETVEHPECYFEIGWYVSAVGEDTVTATDDRTDVGMGEAIAMPVEDIGMDMTSEDGAQFWLTVEAAYREACGRLTDDEESLLVDDDGNVLIA